MIMNFDPLWIPLIAVIFGPAMVVAIVGIVFWSKGREKELQFHQDLRIREMEHQRKMKELEVEMERIKARSVSGQSA